MSIHAALIGRIRQTLLDLEQVVSRCESLLEKARRTADDGYLDGVALNLHGFYTGVERILEDIARVMEESVPAGPDWHRDLLLQASAEIAGVRPPVIMRETRYSLEAYRGFRHVVRNVYTMNLRPARLEELTGDLRPCYEALARDLTFLIGFLEQLTPEGLAN